MDWIRNWIDTNGTRCDQGNVSRVNICEYKLIYSIREDYPVSILLHFHAVSDCSDITVLLIVFSCRPIVFCLIIMLIPVLPLTIHPSCELALSSSYYSIWIPLVIFTGRDFGPMIVAERLTKVYGRTDGGPGKAKGTGGRELASHCSPKPETPCRWWNMVCCAVLIFISHNIITM